MQFFPKVQIDEHPEEKAPPAEPDYDNMTEEELHAYYNSIGYYLASDGQWYYYGTEEEQQQQQAEVHLTVSLMAKSSGTCRERSQLQQKMN